MAELPLGLGHIQATHTPTHSTDWSLQVLVEVWHTNREMDAIRHAQTSMQNKRPLVRKTRTCTLTCWQCLCHPHRWGSVRCSVQPASVRCWLLWCACSTFLYNHFNPGLFPPLSLSCDALQLGSLTQCTRTLAREGKDQRPFSVLHIWWYKAVLSCLPVSLLFSLSWGWTFEPRLHQERQRQLLKTFVSSYLKQFWSIYE